MGIRRAIEQLKCSPEGQRSPQTMAVLDMLADQLEKAQATPVAVVAKPQPVAKKAVKKAK